MIGEIGCNYPLTDVEKKCLIAASKAQVFADVEIILISILRLLVNVFSHIYTFSIKNLT